MDTNTNFNSQQFIPPKAGGVRGSSFGGQGAILKLALQNLIGNGLKTWLNVFVLSISFVLIIFMQGLLEGWSKQAVTDAVSWEIAGGQYWNHKYDPYDPFSIDSSATTLPVSFQSKYNRLFSHHLTE